MPSDPSAPVTVDVVRRVAALARLRIEEEELPQLTAQLGRIVSYIDQIREVPAGSLPGGGVPVPTPLRPDAPIPGEGQRALEANAGTLLHGHGAVPRVVGAIE